MLRKHCANFPTHPSSRTDKNEPKLIVTKNVYFGQTRSKYEKKKKKLDAVFEQKIQLNKDLNLLRLPLKRVL